MADRPPVYVVFAAGVTSESAEVLLNTMATLINDGVPRITLLLSTVGGDLESGLALYNVLRGLPCELTTHAVGPVASSGNLVFLAGARRFACPAVAFIFHGVHCEPRGKLAPMDVRIMRAALCAVQARQRQIADILRERTRLSATVVRQLTSGGHACDITKDAAWAMTYGIVEDVREVQIPPGAVVLSPLTVRRNG